MTNFGRCNLPSIIIWMWSVTFSHSRLQSKKLGVCLQFWQTASIASIRSGVLQNQLLYLQLFRLTTVPVLVDVWMKMSWYSITRGQVTIFCCLCCALCSILMIRLLLRRHRNRCVILPWKSLLIKRQRVQCYKYCNLQHAYFTGVCVRACIGWLY